MKSIVVASLWLLGLMFAASDHAPLRATEVSTKTRDQNLLGVAGPPLRADSVQNTAVTTGVGELFGIRPGRSRWTVVFLHWCLAGRETFTGWGWKLCWMGTVVGLLGFVLMAFGIHAFGL